MQQITRSVKKLGKIRHMFGDAERDQRPKATSLVRQQSVYKVAEPDDVHVFDRVEVNRWVVRLLRDQTSSLRAISFGHTPTTPLGGESIMKRTDLYNGVNLVQTDE